MSILKEYERHIDLIGKEKLKALLSYVKEEKILYSDVIYNRKDWEEFDNWYKEVYNTRYGKSTGGNKKV